MRMDRTALTLALALTLAPTACERGDRAAADPAIVPDTTAAATPPDKTAAALADQGETGEVGGRYAEGLSADAVAGAAQAAPAYGAGDGPDLDALKAAVDRVQQANERLRQIEASKPRSATAPPAPAPSAPSAPPGQPDLPPTQFRLTGDSIVPKAPELANDVIRGMQRVFATQTGCTAITGIDTRAVSAQGPFDRNAQGRLVSGTIVERWDVRGCGRTAAYHLVLRVRPDATVDYAIQRA
jgi:hypothetical protein